MVILFANQFFASLDDAISTIFHELGFGTPSESLETKGHDVGTEIVKSSSIFSSTPLVVVSSPHEVTKVTTKTIKIAFINWCLKIFTMKEMVYLIHQEQKKIKTKRKRQRV